MPPIFVDAHDLVERFDVGYDTVLTWVRRGKIPHIRDGREPADVQSELSH